MDMKPLSPLSSGVIVLAGVKASNFDEEIRTHPRIVMWSSQEEHWQSKDLPSNTRAVFMTRFIGHAAFKNIVAEARKRHITVFNPMGTGIIARQVRELLALPRPLFESNVPEVIEREVERIITEPVKETTEMPNTGKKLGARFKLKVLIPFIDFNRTPIENAREILMPKAKEFGIQTTIGSLAQFTTVQRNKQNTKVVFRKNAPSVKAQSVDVSVEILDGLIKGLQDMRQFLIDTTNENQVLRGKLETLKKVFA